MIIVTLFPFSCALCTSFNYESWHVIFNYHYKLHPRTLVFTRKVAPAQNLLAKSCPTFSKILYSWTGDRQDPAWQDLIDDSRLGLYPRRDIYFLASIRSCQDIAYLLPKNTRSWKPWARHCQEFFCCDIIN